MPSDTFFSEAPHWGWWIVLYFFFGGIAAGSFFFAALIDLFGGGEGKRLARLGYLVALPALALCPPLLIVDLDRPERFWHMLLQSHELSPMFKPYSPMSLGSWALALFGMFATLAFLGALAEGGRLRALAFLRRGMVAKVIAVVGGGLGFVVAGYTGVLLSVTNRPVWADSRLVGALFLLSAATSSGALLVWLGQRRAEAGAVGRLARIEGWISIVEIVALVGMAITLGPVVRAWVGIWGLALVAVVVLGLVAPLVLHHRPFFGARSVAVGGLLTLVGGLLLRAVVIFSSEAM